MRPAPPPTPGSPATAPNKLPAAEALKLLERDRDRYWQNARREIHRSARELLAQQEDETERGTACRTLIRGDRRRKEIALTFDDGPHPGFTERLLAILTDKRVPAAFFVVGEMGERHPELLRALARAGVTVGNHTYHHVSLPKIPDEFVLDEIKACGEVIATALGRPPRWFRPPGGQYDRGVTEAVQALGYAMALWTDDPGDYDNPSASVLLDKTLERATPGGIILLHDGVDVTVQILPALIDRLRARGFRFVTLERLESPTSRAPIF